jgi:hypothetical protein
MKSLCGYAIYLERVRDLDAAEAEAADFGFFFSKLNLAAANNTADISGARLTPPFVFGVCCFFLGDEGFFTGFTVGISIIIRIN